MKFIYITGGPCTAKSTIVGDLEKTMGESSKDHHFLPMDLFKGILYKKTNTFVMHLDETSYGVISKFKEFVNLMNKLNISVLAEGDRWTTAKYIEWLLETYPDNSKVFLLTVDEKTEELRHEKRGDNQNLQWIKGRRQMSVNLLNNLFLRDKLTVRDTSDTIKHIKEEIMNELLH